MKKNLMMLAIFMMIVLSCSYANNWNIAENVTFGDSRGSTIADDMVSSLSSSLGKTRRYYSSKLYIKDSVSLLDDRFCVSVDGSAVFFDGNELYAFASSEDYESNNTICFLVRNSSGIQMVYPNINYSKYGGNLCEPNISVTNDSRYLLLTCYISKENGSLSSALIVLNNDFDVVSDVIVPNIKLTGNTLITPQGYILHAGRERGSAVYRSNEKFSNDISKIKFSKVNSLESSEAKESTIGYFNNNLVAIYRNSSGKVFVTYTSDKEGSSNWKSPKTLDREIYFVSIPSENSGSALPFTCDYFKREDAMSAYIGFVNVDDATITYFREVDSSIEASTGYSSVLPHRDGYGILYYEEYDDCTAMCLKDFQYGFENTAMEDMKLSGTETNNFLNIFDGTKGTALGKSITSNIAVDYDKTSNKFNVMFGYQKYKTYAFNLNASADENSVSNEQLEDLIELAKLCGVKVDFSYDSISFELEGTIYNVNTGFDGQMHNTQKVESTFATILDNKFSFVDLNSNVARVEQNGITIVLSSDVTNVVKVLATSNGKHVSNISYQIDGGASTEINEFKSIYLKKDGGSHSLSITTTCDDGSKAVLNYNY